MILTKEQEQRLEEAKDEIEKYSHGLNKPGVIFELTSHAQKRLIEQSVLLLSLLSEQTPKLTWVANELFVGKICVGGVSKNFGVWHSEFSSSYRGIHGCFCTGNALKSEPKARQYLEEFVREQMKAK